MTGRPVPGTAIHRLGPLDVDLMESLSAVFGTAFDERETYLGAPPPREYSRRLLSRRSFIALVAVRDGQVVGGAAAYELPKFERDRSEIYIYDLAVLAEHRRCGIATALIDEIRRIAAACGAHVVYVQADPGDDAAVALYTKLGSREDVLHFDMTPL